MQRVTVRFLLAALVLMGTIHGTMNRGFSEVYVHSDSLTYQWAPATGHVDFYEVFVSVNGQDYEKITNAVIPAAMHPLEYRMDVEDRSRYRLRVRAVSETMGAGPLSYKSESVTVILNGTDDDTDGDLLPDEWEELYGFDPFDPATAVADTDSDLLSNLDEFLNGTDPRDPDSDHDGVGDGTEVLAGMNPMNPMDNTPVADAGPDQTKKPNRLVALNGFDSWDPNGDLLSYRWVQKKGPSTVAMLGKNAPICLFFVSAVGQYVFSLVVSDGVVDSNPDRVRIWVSNEDVVIPVARAGRDFYAPVEGPVIMDGTESTDPEGMSLSYNWYQVDGPRVVLENEDTSMPRFYPPSAGTYVFELTVGNGNAVSESDPVTVYVEEDLVPGDVFPHGGPDGVLDFWDLALWWFLYLRIPAPSEEEFFAIDVAPMTILDPEGEPVGIRLEPDGYFSLEDGILLGEISRGIYRVIGWEDDSE